ncbi:hypothetical protein EYF80_015051 [Liparis tanakae]|uniref:Uncharacterized protein n=1 Tax=Liparis tanakae TaxID=230148 RepID=A0A4Z2ICD6_9TELE|nr:hypothetical protein EYF80_015051 [Liparis tanakae]
MTDEDILVRLHWSVEANNREAVILVLIRSLDSSSTGTRSEDPGSLSLGDGVTETGVIGTDT